MAFGDFLGAGGFTFGVIFIFVIAILFAFKLIGWIFGKGKRKGLGEASENEKIEILSEREKVRGVARDLETDSAKIGELEKVEEVSQQNMQGMDNLLKDVIATKDFNNEKKAIMNNMLTNEAKMLRDKNMLVLNLHIDLQKEKKALDIVKFKKIIQAQEEEQRLAIQRETELKKYNYDDTSAIRIVAIAEEIKPFEEQIKVYEEKENQSWGRRQDVHNQYLSLIKERTNAVTALSDLMRKEPLLAQVPRMQVQEETIKQKTPFIHALLNEEKSLLEEAKKDLKAILEAYAKISSLAEEQAKLAEESEKNLSDLKTKNAVPQGTK